MNSRNDQDRPGRRRRWRRWWRRTPSGRTSPTSSPCRSRRPCHFVGRGAVEQRQRAEPAAFAHADIHYVVADEIEHPRRWHKDILQADDRSVAPSPFEHGETAHIHITSAPHTRNEKLFRTNWVSSEHKKCGNREADGGGTTAPIAIAEPAGPTGSIPGSARVHFRSVLRCPTRCFMSSRSFRHVHPPTLGKSRKQNPRYRDACEPPTVNRPSRHFELS